MGPAEGIFFFLFLLSLFFDRVADSELWLQSLAELGASPRAPHRLSAAARQRRLTMEAALDVGIAPLHGRCCHCFLPKCIYYRINTITGSLWEVWKKRKPCRRNSPSQSLKLMLFSSLLWWWLNFTFSNKYNFVVYIHISVCIYMHIHVPKRKRRGWLLTFQWA